MVNDEFVLRSSVLFLQNLVIRQKKKSYYIKRINKCYYFCVHSVVILGHNYT